MEQLGGDLYVGGWFDHAGDQPSFGIAHWAGHAPSPTPPDPSTPLVPAGVALSIHSALVTGDHVSLRYGLPSSGHARLDLYDLRGSRVATLLDRVVSAGETVLDWTPGSPAPFPGSGVYFLRLRFGEHAATAKIVFAR